jgi:phage shock protein A
MFSRLAQLIKSNLNDLISRSEDPEKMLNQVLLDMNSQLIEAKKQVASAIADEKRLAKQAEQEQTQAAEWEKRAMLAIRSNDEALAREALARKKEHDTLAAGFQEQWAKQKSAVDNLKQALVVLNDKIEEAKRKKNVLIARKKRAEAQKAIQETMNGLSDRSAFETLARMESKIDQLEAETEAQGELAEHFTGDRLAQKFSALEKSSGADDDLAALKRKMGLAPPEPAPARAAPVQTRVETSTPAKEEDELAAALEALEQEEAAALRSKK